MTTPKERLERLQALVRPRRPEPPKPAEPPAPAPAPALPPAPDPKPSVIRAKQLPRKHHPKAICDALRLHGIHPMQDAPARNSMRLFLKAEELRGRLRYIEGVISTHYNYTPHAWLAFDGQTLDLTLMPLEGRIYSGYACSLEKVQAAFERDEGYDFVDANRLNALIRAKRSFRPV